jgi:hypothetical protein
MENNVYIYGLKCPEKDTMNMENIMTKYQQQVEKNMLNGFLHSLNGNRLCCLNYMKKVIYGLLYGG